MAPLGQFGASDQNGAFSYFLLLFHCFALKDTEIKEKRRKYVLQTMRIYVFHLQRRNRQKFKNESLFEEKAPNSPTWDK